MRAIKDETLAHLDEHLLTLEKSVERRGGQVHFADDSGEACRIIVEILQARNARRVVKSKSMTSEEIGLNHALESQGMEVTETDFGEYIIQRRAAAVAFGGAGRAFDSGRGAEDS